MITKGMLLQRSAYFVNDEYYGVLSFRKAKERLARKRTVITICSEKDNMYFFTEDHSFGIGVLPRHWVPCTAQLPMNVFPRPGLESGLVDTIEKYMIIFHRHHRCIYSIDDLLYHLNENERE